MATVEGTLYVSKCIRRGRGQTTINNISSGRPRGPGRDQLNARVRFERGPIGHTMPRIIEMYTKLLWCWRWAALGMYNRMRYYWPADKLADLNPFDRTSMRRTVIMIIYVRTSRSHILCEYDVTIHENKHSFVGHRRSMQYRAAAIRGETRDDGVSPIVLCKWNFLILIFFFFLNIFRRTPLRP